MQILCHWWAGLYEGLTAIDAGKLPVFRRRFDKFSALVSRLQLEV